MGEGSVQVTMAAIIDQLHSNYGKIVGRLTQENAELQAAVDAQDRELSELRSQVAALRPAPRQGPGLIVPQPVLPTDLTRRPVQDRPQA